MKIELETTHGKMTVTESDLVPFETYDFFDYDHLYLLHHEFGVVALVYADNEAEALDYIADAHKIDMYRVPHLDDEIEEPGENIHYLGNESLAYDFGDYVRLIEIPKPEFSLTGSLAAAGARIVE